VDAAKAAICASATNAPFVPQSVSSTDLSCCTLHEWPVFPPRGGVDEFAIAAFSVLRARAARKPYSHIGLFADFRCDCTRNQREIGRRVAAQRT
jgi:hypothetical protein